MAMMTREEFARRLARRAGELAVLRRDGTRVVGYVSGHVPAELVRAAGAVPVRLLEGGHAAETHGERWLRSDACAVCLSTLGNLAPGADSGMFPVRLDAFLSVTACDLVRRLPENVGAATGLPVLQLYLPRSSEPLPHRVAAFRGELERLAAEMARLTGVTATPERLLAEIAAANAVRRQLRELDRLRRDDRPTVSLTDILDLTALAGVLDPPALLGLLSSLHPRPLDPSAPSSARPRLLLCGSEVAWQDRWLVELLEQRADIVTDLLDTASLSFAADCPEDGDPLDALARYWYANPPAPWRRPNDALFALARERVREARVAGVVLKTLLYCDPWSFESRRLKASLGLPLLHIDGSYSAENREQLRTRVEAFLEEL